MRRGLVCIFGLLVFVGLISFAGATCSNADQIIMKLTSSTLTSSTNAHGALWNQSYGANICYNDLFSTNYIGENPHDGCTAPNNGMILKLYSENNSHADTTSAYPIHVCYKGLKNCKLDYYCDDDNPKCNEIAYISSATNAHLSSIPYGSGGSSYLPISCECTDKDCSAVPTPVGPTGCYDFTFDDDCEDAGDIALSDPGCKGESCKCIWENNKCSVQWSMPSPDDPDCVYTCTVPGTTVTECLGGSKIISTIAATTKTNCGIGSLPPVGFVCQSGSATIPCGGIEEASLPFFGAWQIVSSLMAITFIYFLINRKNK